METVNMDLKISVILRKSVVSLRIDADSRGLFLYLELLMKDGCGIRNEGIVGNYFRNGFKHQCISV